MLKFPKLNNNKQVNKSIEYPVYMTEKGKLFIVYPNKEGTGYNKKYIKQEQYEQIKYF